MATLLSNENLKFRERMTGDYPRWLHDFDERLQLKKWGLTHVVSSFISGIGEKDGDLFIRFHNGTHYQYYGFGDHYRPMMKSLSKGQYFWRHIRKTTRYAKIGTLNFTGGNVSSQTDEELFKQADNEMIDELLGSLKGDRTITTEKLVLHGIEYVRYSLDDVFSFLLPLINMT